MSIMLSLCIRGRKLANTVYGKTLAYRKLPLHLGFVTLESGTTDEIAAKTRAKADELGLNPEQLITGRAKSELIKPAPLPKLVSWKKPSGKRILEAFESRSSIFLGKGLPAAYDLLHFYMER